ncbi:6-pyruvoyltetrahydropterin/6-carboxytetrahydropterin synthase [Paludibacterium purpuratum]|uniref:6-carboxy-5,6,7,8-tetrahydropterin synthase n=1 Tax=Paludibacterium purpuratum TaxID=1144873 RepID=A0A4R7B026_9NEIS|nr:6-pyruvoyltetrahydropterin/6-carboxytetrahydropterin synthase [Paludibacterium purpuratum]
MHTTFLLAATGFEAARRIPGATDERLINTHGHSFRALARADATHTDQATLEAALATAAAPLHYAQINDTLADPDDLGIARYLADSISSPVTLALQSSMRRGALVDNNLALVSLTVSFEAAHQLPQVPAGHKCGRLHGHRFGVRLFADAARCDHMRLEAAWQPLFERLNHRYLNDIDGLDNPTSEVLAKWLFERLRDTLPGLAWVEVRETHSAGSQYDGQHFNIWKEQRFESAVPFAQDGAYTGHSYLIRLMLTGDLDRTMGWVLDFGDVKDRFKPVYRQLDHNPLDRLSGIRNGKSTSVAEWVHVHLAPLVPELSRIDLYDTAERGVSLTFDHDMRWPLL